MPRNALHTWCNLHKWRLHGDCVQSVRSAIDAAHREQRCGDMIYAMHPRAMRHVDANHRADQRPSSCAAITVSPRAAITVRRPRVLAVRGSEWTRARATRVLEALQLTHHDRVDGSDIRRCYASRWHRPFPAHAAHATTT